MENINVNLEGFQGPVLEIREGKALELQNPVANAYTGVIGSPKEFIKNRLGQFNHLNSIVIVNRDNLSIKLRIDEKNVFGDSVTGKLELSEKFKKFGINNGKYITAHELADLFKMNRTSFENKDVAMKLVADLQNFRAKVNAEIEKKNDNRANITELTKQTVNSNLPQNFKIKLEIFKGQDSSLVEVEIYIRPDDLCCTLVSAEANDIIETTRNQIIDAELEEIRTLAPAILIIEQ